MLLCDEKEITHNIAFTVWCELWGRDLVVDDLLGEPMYDSHAVNCSVRTSSSRSFVVPCSILNEDLVGGDEIYVKVNAISSLGLTFTGSSPVVKARF